MPGSSPGRSSTPSSIDEEHVRVGDNSAHNSTPDTPSRGAPSREGSKEPSVDQLQLGGSDRAGHGDTPTVEARRARAEPELSPS